MAGSLSMVLVGHGGTEQSHHAIADKLVDGAFVFVDFVHQNFKTPVHDLVDVFGIEFLSDGCVIGHIRK
jgi:hypothetical protein